MTAFQRKHTDGQKAHEKMLNVTDYWKNANHKMQMRFPKCKSKSAKCKFKIRKCKLQIEK